MNRRMIQKLSLSGIFVAAGVALSAFNIPIGVTKCFPIQHLINVLGAVLLGPVYNLICAFCVSLIRVSLGTGSLLAFPGSMVGALTCALVYKFSRKIWAAALGELFGTGVLGALCAYPAAVLLMGREVAVYAFIIPFSGSALLGSAFAALLLYALGRKGMVEMIKKEKCA